MKDKSDSDILKIDDAARYLGVTRRWIYRRIWSGDLPASKVGGLYFLRKDDLEELLAQGRLGDQPIGPEPSAMPSLKCGYCFRLLETDSAVGDVCRAEGCEELICEQCLREKNFYCTQHVPDREQLWVEALEQYRTGQVVVLLKGSQARLREINFIQRMQTRLHHVNTLKHPLSDELINIQDWDAIQEEHDERPEIMKMINKAVLDADWVSRIPLNSTLKYQVEPGNKQKFAPISILVRVLSHSKSMLQQGFDTKPFTADELARLLLNIGEQAQKKRTFTIVMLASLTGWDEEARQVIRGDAAGTAFSHRWLLMYLNDLEKREIIYNRLDGLARAYADLFATTLPDEEIDEISHAIEEEMAIYKSLTLEQAVQALPYSQKSLERAFSKLAEGGRYALTEVPGLGQTIVRT